MRQIAPAYNLKWGLYQNSICNNPATLAGIPHVRNSRHAMEQNRTWCDFLTRTSYHPCMKLRDVMITSSDVLCVLSLHAAHMHDLRSDNELRWGWITSE